MEAITDICLLSKKDKVPSGYSVIEHTVDGKKADFAEGSMMGFGSTKRYLAYTRKVPSSLRGRLTLVDIKVVPSNERSPLGYLPLGHTQDDNTKAFSQKVLVIKVSPHEKAKRAVTELQILSASRKEDVQPGFTRLPEINGLSICFKVSSMASTVLPSQGLYSTQARMMQPVTIGEPTEGEETAITDICIFSKQEKVPSGYSVIEHTVDGKKADFAEGSMMGFGSTKCYLAYTRKVPSSLRGRCAVLDLKVIPSKDCAPFGYIPLAYTHDDNTKAFSQKVLVIKVAPHEKAKRAVTELQILSASRKEDVQPGFTRLPDINGFSICFKVGEVGKKSFLTPADELAIRVAAQFEVTPATQLKPPNWWTVCPNCSPDSNKRFHLIEVAKGGQEWESVTRPLTKSKFIPKRLLRVQNLMLYDKLEFEKHSMLNERVREEGYSVNERLLYHTSSAAVSTICREGLDQRLSGDKGRFGRGVYFSDDPVKCNGYWRRRDSTRKMFACLVLLGKAKVYPDNTMDSTLVREPRGYDSVKGNVTGHNEFIIYLHYRAMPAYVVEYSIL